MEEKLKNMEKEAIGQLRTATDLSELDSIRVKYLGRKGALTEILRSMRDVPAEDRPVVGKLINQVKELINSELELAIERLKQKEREAELAAEAIDITLPGRRPRSSWRQAARR